MQEKSSKCQYVRQIRVLVSAVKLETCMEVSGKKLSMEFSCVSKSMKGIDYVFCKTTCCTDFSVGNSSRDIFNRSNINLTQTQLLLPNQSRVHLNQVDSALREELHFAACVAEPNHPFSVADHFTDLCDIAKKFCCKRTKDSYLVTKAPALETEKRVNYLCGTNKFSIIIGESVTVMRNA